MLTHVHKVIHLVVGTFEQGLGTSPTLYTEKMEVTGSDRTLALVGPTRQIRCSSEDTGVDQTIGHWVALRPVMLSVNTVRSHNVTGCWQGPVEHDRTCPVGKNRFWYLIVNDRTLVFSVRSTQALCPIKTDDH